MVLGEGVDAAPGGNDGAVVELLRPASLTQPDLSDKQQNRQDNAIADEGAPHDEVRRTLPHVLPLTEAQRSDGAEDDLYPRQDGEDLSEKRVAGADQPSDLAIDALLPVTAEVYPENDLSSEGDLQDVRKGRVNIVPDELASAVHVAEEETDDGEADAEDLRGDVPS